jgi:hypothetical protein
VRGAKRSTIDSSRMILTATRGVNATERRRGREGLCVVDTCGDCAGAFDKKFNSLADASAFESLADASGFQLHVDASSEQVLAARALRNSQSQT